jgi:3-hydroxymyristoyl/3-hydroxydecanoyl-(acyl carrier protein) dehydratase
MQPFDDTMTGDHWPQLIDAQQRDDRADLVLQISADLHWLKGHFPSQPVLAGVVQTDWACRLALRLFNLDHAPQRIDNLKFQNVIMPPQTVRLELVRNASTGSISFRYSNPEEPGQTFSEGKLVF